MVTVQMEEKGIFDQFKEIYTDRHEYAKAWKEKTGGKVLGYFCTYVPEEILYAANILPVRILGSHEPQDVTEPHIFAMFCPFCRDCLAQGLKGRYDYLDGIMIAQSCLHIRQAYTSWDLHIPTDYSYYLPPPMHVLSPRAIPFVKQVLPAPRSSLSTTTRRFSMRCRHYWSAGHVRHGPCPISPRSTRLSAKASVRKSCSLTIT